jgi:hypothetical protein
MRIKKILLKNNIWLERRRLDIIHELRNPKLWSNAEKLIKIWKLRDKYILESGCYKFIMGLW